MDKWYEANEQESEELAYKAKIDSLALLYACILSPPKSKWSALKLNSYILRYSAVPIIDGRLDPDKKDRPVKHSPLSKDIMNFLKLYQTSVLQRLEEGGYN